MTNILFQTFSMFSFKHHSKTKDILNYLFLPDDVTQRKNKNQLKITKVSKIWVFSHQKQ